MRLEVSDVPVPGTGVHLSIKPDPPAAIQETLECQNAVAPTERKTAKKKEPAVAVPKAMAKTVTPLFFNTTLPAGLCPALLMPPLAQTTRAPASLPVAQVRVSLQVHPDGVNVRTEVQPQNAGRC